MYILLVERPSEPLHLKIAESDLTQSTSMAPRAFPFFFKVHFPPASLLEPVSCTKQRAWHHPSSDTCTQQGMASPKALAQNKEQGTQSKVHYPWSITWETCTQARLHGTWHHSTRLNGPNAGTAHRVIPTNPPWAKVKACSRHRQRGKVSQGLQELSKGMHAKGKVLRHTSFPAASYGLESTLASACFTCPWRIHPQSSCVQLWPLESVWQI